MHTSTAANTQRRPSPAKTIGQAGAPWMVTRPGARMLVAPQTTPADVEQLVGALDAFSVAERA